MSEKLENKIDKLDARLDSIEIVLTRNTQILDEHQRRSLANEEHVNQLENKLIQDLLPIKTHVETVKLGIKIITWLCVAFVGITGFILTLKQLGFVF